MWLHFGVATVQPARRLTYTDPMSEEHFPRANWLPLLTGIGWLLAIVSMAAIRWKIRTFNVPGPLKGLGITMIMTGLMAMAFMCFSGINL